MKKFSVTLEMKPITVEVESNNENEKVLLELAKAEVLKQLAIKFPGLTYSITEGSAIINPQPGMLVRVKDSKLDEVGVITAVNSKSMNVTLKGGRSIRSSFGLVSKADKAKFEDVFTPRHELMRNAWYEGDTGYLVAKNEIIPVIAGKSGKANTKFYIVNDKGGQYYTLTESQTRFVFDSVEDAKKYLKTKKAV